MHTPKPSKEEYRAMIIATYILMDDGYELEEAKEHIMHIYRNQKGKTC